MIYKYFAVEKVSSNAWILSLLTRIYIYIYLFIYFFNMVLPNFFSISPLSLSHTAALDTHAKDLEEIKQLTGEIGMQAKTRVSEIRTSRDAVAHKGTPSISSMGSVVDMAP